MEVGYVFTDQLTMYLPLLLPAVRESLEQGVPVSVLGMEEDETACGALACGIDERGEPEILSLYVAPDYRRRGGGRRMVEVFLDAARQLRPGGRATCHFTVTEAEHETVPPFLKALGFEQQESGETIYFTTLQQVLENEFFGPKTGGDNQSIRPFCKLDEQTLLIADRRARKDLAPMPEKPLTDPGVEKEISCAQVKNEIVTAMLVFDHSCAGRLTLACAWSDGTSPMAIPVLLHHAMTEMKRLCPPETELAVQAVNRASADLILKLVPGATPVSHSYFRPLETELDWREPDHEQ